MKSSLLICLTFLVSLIGYSQLEIPQVNLPKGMTENEKLIMEDYLQSFNDRGITSPPPFANIRTAENGKKFKH
jgi:hypothetical protein